MNIKANYIGKDGAMGFRNDQKYRLIRFEEYGSGFIVETEDNQLGYYSNEKSARRNWELKGEI